MLCCNVCPSEIRYIPCDILEDVVETFPVLECYRMLLYIAACCCYCCKGKIWFLVWRKRTEPIPLPNVKRKTTYLQYQGVHLPDPTCFVGSCVAHPKKHGACLTFTIIYQANTNLRPLYWSPTASFHNYPKKNASRLTIRGKQPLTQFEPSEKPVYICLFFPACTLAKQIATFCSWCHFP